MKFKLSYRRGFASARIVGPEVAFRIIPLATLGAKKGKPYGIPSDARVGIEPCTKLEIIYRRLNHGNTKKGTNQKTGGKNNVENN